MSGVEKRALHFSISGEFITRTAREWFFIEHKPYSVVEELLLSCMPRPDIPECTLKIMAQDILLGRAEFRGNSGDDTFCYIKQDSPTDVNIFSEYGKMCQKCERSEEDLSAMTEKYLNVVASLQMWAEGSTANALEELSDNEVKRLFISILRNYGEVRERYTHGAGWSIEFADGSESVAISPKDTGGPLLNSFLQQRRIEEEFEDNYGWLDPTGDFTPVEWGEHQSWAHDEAVRRGYLPKDAIYACKEGDTLIEHGWVLLHNPAMGVATVSKNPARALTKAQREFLYGYYTDRKQHHLAEQYFDE